MIYIILYKFIREFFLNFVIEIKAHKVFEKKKYYRPLYF